MVALNKWFTDLFKSKATKEKEELQRQWSKCFEGVTGIDHLENIHIALDLLETRPEFFKTKLNSTWVSSVFKNPRIFFHFGCEVYMVNNLWVSTNEKVKKRMREAIHKFLKNT